MCNVQLQLQDDSMECTQCLATIHVKCDANHPISDTYICLLCRSEDPPKVLSKPNSLTTSTSRSTIQKEKQDEQLEKKKKELKEKEKEVKLRGKLVTEKSEKLEELTEALRGSRIRCEKLSHEVQQLKISHKNLQEAQNLPAEDQNNGIKHPFIKHSNGTSQTGNTDVLRMQHENQHQLIN